MTAGLTMSTVWTQLALPLSPFGTVPFVSADLVTIDIDPPNFLYTPSGSPLSGTLNEYQHTITGGIRVGWLNNSQTDTTARIMHSPSGSLTIPVGSSSITVTNKYCHTNSLVFLQKRTLNTGVVTMGPQISEGSFNIVCDTVPTANTRVDFHIVNTTAPGA
jgi:hypothetical protein